MTRLLLPAAAVLALAACGPTTPPGPTLVSRGSVTSGAFTVELLSAAPLAVGVNHVAWRIKESGAAVTMAHLTQKPLMTMPGMQHSCPQVAPEHDANAAGLFEGVVVFNMPSSATETWDLALDVRPHDSTSTTTVTFEDLAVVDSGNRKMLTVGSMMYLVGVGFPAGTAKMGSNAVTVSVHRPTDMTKMSWVPVTDLTLTATPEMPSMGHGSSGNVNPTHVADGLYEGTVNLSMSGDWVVHLAVKDAGGAALGTLDFSYSL